jgi:Putative beta-barrel porin 2
VTTSNRKLLHAAALAALATTATTRSFGFAEVARGALTLETEGRLTYDSYFIGADNPNDDDYYLTLRPELHYDRKAGLGEISGFAGVSLMRYDKNTRYDSENFSAGIMAQLPADSGARLTGELNLGYTESTVVNFDVLDRIPTKAFHASLNARYQLGLKTSFADTLTYSQSHRKGYSDQDVFGNDLSFIYADFLRGTTLRLTHGYDRTTSSGENYLGAELDQTANSLSATLSRPILGPVIGQATYGYRVLKRSARENTIGQTKIKGAFFSLGLHGPFLPPSRFPKLESSASFTYQESPNPGINDVGQKTLTGDIRLAWQARERTRISTNATRTVDLSATDLSVENTIVGISVDQKVGIATTLGARVGYTWRSYRGVEREDETLDASVDARYQITKYWSAGASYTYQDNSTNAENLNSIPVYRMRALDFSRHLVSVYVTNVF